MLRGAGVAWRMFWLLVVMLWPAQGAPQGIVAPIAFPSEQTCQAGGTKLLSDIVADRPDTIAAVTMRCAQFSNPRTEHAA